jgi:hypothetical protein
VIWAHGGGHGGASVDSREEDDARGVKAARGGASGLGRCEIMIQTEWRDELVNGSVVVMISPI